MELLTHEITLGFSNETGILNIPISQYDINRVISIGFTDYGEEYEIPDGTNVYLKAKKPDGTEIDTDEFCSIVDNKVHLQIFKQLSVVDGTVRCEVILSGENGTQYTSNHFNLIVNKSVHNDENLRSSDEYKNIIEILLEIEFLRENLLFKTDKDIAGGVPSLNENTKIPRNELYDADLKDKGIVKLVDSIESDSVVDAATPNSVKNVNDSLEYHKDDKNNPHNVDKSQIGLENVDNTSDIDKPVSTAQQSTINSAVTNHNTSTSAHDDIRNLISGLTTRLNTLADSDDTTLDQLNEIVSYIKNNKELIDSITTSKVSVSDIIDNLTSTATDKPLSANQGKVLKFLISELNTKVTTSYATKNMVEDLKKSVSDGKAKVADAITEKGVETAADATFAMMAENINQISGDVVNLQESRTIKSFVGNDGMIIIPEDDYDGFSQVILEGIEGQEKNVDPTTTLQTIKPDEGKALLGVHVTPISTQTKTVSPSTSAQTVKPDSGYNGLSQVTVNAISTQTKTVSPSTSAQTVKPDSGYNGLSQVTVNAISTQTKTATPSTSSQTITPDSGKYLSSVTVNAVSNQAKTVTPSTSAQTVKPDNSYNGLSQVTVNAISTQTKTVSPSTSAQTLKPDTGKYLSSVTVNAASLQAKTVTPTTSAQTVKPDSGYFGLSQVTVNAKTNPTSVTLTGSSQIKSTSSGITNINTSKNFTVTLTPDSTNLSGGTSSFTTTIVNLSKTFTVDSTGSKTVTGNTKVTGVSFSEASSISMISEHMGVDLETAQQMYNAKNVLFEFEENELEIEKAQKISDIITRNEKLIAQSENFVSETHDIEIGHLSNG